MFQKPKENTDQLIASPKHTFFMGLFKNKFLELNKTHHRMKTITLTHEYTSTTIIQVMGWYKLCAMKTPPYT